MNKSLVVETSVIILKMLSAFLLFSLIYYSVISVYTPKIHYEFIKEVRISDTTEIYWAHREYRNNGTLYRENERQQNLDLDEVYYGEKVDANDNPIAIMERYKNGKFETYLLYRTYDKYGNWVTIEKVKAKYRYTIFSTDDLPARSLLDEVYSVTQRDITYRD